ncbi:S-adenosyl-L-methionine-dependent methyltransferase superfamily protein [Zea mays]|nr:S-adenosyl-L-methionine-dependent methyltransferase superfamily protein [Zea mays]
MKAPSLLVRCFPGLLPSKDTSCVPIVSEKDLQLPSLAVEIIPSKGKVSVADMISFSPSEVASSKYDGALKSWENSITLVNIIRNEIRDGQLSFRGKRVLELGCGSGVSGIFSCLKGASTVHFQDMNAETIRCRTIPNVLANLEQARDRQNRPSEESPVTPSRQLLDPNVHFYAGEWDELPTVLSAVPPPAAPADLSFSEDDFMDGGSSSHDGSSVVVGQDYCPRRSRKLSGSRRAWERANNETDQADGGYDVILVSDVPYAANSLKKLHALISKCLRPPYGVMYYVASKKSSVGSNGGARQLRALMEEGGVLGGHLLTEVCDREIWKFFFK